MNFSRNSPQYPDSLPPASEQSAGDPDQWRPRAVNRFPARRPESDDHTTSDLRGRTGVPRLIGTSSAIRDVVQEVDLVCNRRCNVLIEGETGTGKEVVARAIHESGARRKGPWIAVNCGAIPETLLEGELFGHVRGAFTGAVQARAGKFEAANRGTIFLDEIAEMPLSVQAKLLRVLQEREVERLGGNEKIPLDVRVVAATNSGLAERVRRGLFRDDLFYRLNVFRIELPSLRDRPGDIPALARHFVDRICREEACSGKGFDPAAMSRLCSYAWPGNVRELENAIETSVILSGTRPMIGAADLRIGRGEGRMNPVAGSLSVAIPIPDAGLDYQRTMEEFEQGLLTQALTRARGNKTAAAELLGLKRTTLAAKMRALESRLPRLVA